MNLLFVKASARATLAHSRGQLKVGRTLSVINVTVRISPSGLACLMALLLTSFAVALFGSGLAITWLDRDAGRYR
jgi:hypothetical protein